VNRGPGTTVKKYVTEFTGTFCLVLTVALITASGAVLGPLVVGLALAAFIYAGAPFSGAHYNPAATIGIWLRGAAVSSEIGLYMLFQLLGAVLAAGLSLWITGSSYVPVAHGAVPAVFGAEFLGTFALVFVILYTATVEETRGNWYFGLAIGLTVTAGAFLVGGISGAAFNPALAAGSFLVQMAMDGGAPAGVWVYMLGPATGAVAAAYLFCRFLLGENVSVRRRTTENP